MSLQAFKGQGWRLKSPCQFNWLSLSLLNIWHWMANSYECVSKIKFLEDRSINRETEKYQHWTDAGITRTSMEVLVSAAGKEWHKFLAIVHFTGSYKWWGSVCLALPMTLHPNEFLKPLWKVIFDTFWHRPKSMWLEEYTRGRACLRHCRLCTSGFQLIFYCLPQG